LGGWRLAESVAGLERNFQVTRLDEKQWQTMFNETLACSDVIRYLSLGNPEFVLISAKEEFEEFVRRKTIDER
jgi:hypothetical protein